VILNVFFRNEWRYAETWHDMGTLTMSVLRTMEAGSEIASFGFSDRRHSGVSGPDNNLRLAINRETGFGGLIWFVDRSSPRQGEIFDYVWVSDNPEPPVEDPRVASDPWTPVYLDRRSVLPLSRIRAALEEFCRVGSGVRPESIDWVRGQMNGMRLDVEGC
jgi:Immunity protein Imm1